MRIGSHAAISISGTLLQISLIAMQAFKVSLSILIVSLLNTIADVSRTTSITAPIRRLPELAGVTIPVTATKIAAPNRTQTSK
jgi:hypothetical protein